MSTCQVENTGLWSVLAEKMRAPGGVEIKKRTFQIFRSYENAFVGSEAVDWLIKNGYAKSRDEAVVIGEKLITLDIIHHITYSHHFKDEPIYYRFKEDDPFEVKLKIGDNISVSSLLTSCGVTQHGYVLRKGTIRWNKRYLVLKQDESRLYYYNTDLDPAARFYIQLDASLSVKEAPGARKGCYCFTIFAPNTQKAITFACESSKNQEAWMSSISAAGVALQEETLDSQAVTEKSIYEFTCRDIHSNEMNLSGFQGKVCIIVNVASK